MPTYSYTTLDDPLAAGSGTYPLGINGAGQIVGFYLGISPADSHGFLYSGGSYTTLDAPLAVPTGAFPSYGINDAGQIVGTYYDSSSPSRPHGFLYSGGSYTSLDDGRIPYGINDAGQIVGSFGPHGFVYSGGSYTTFDYPLATSTVAQGINDAGQIVGTYYDSSGLSRAHGFLYSGGSYTTLDDPLALGGFPSGTTATGINDAGQIVGTYYGADGIHGFLYSGGSYTTLDAPLAFADTTATGINDAGQIVGTYNGSGGHGDLAHGFLAQPTKNSPPLAKDDIAGVANGNVVTTDAVHGVLSNDTDPDSDSLHISAVNGAAANVGHTVDGAFGSLTLNADGSYCYAANGCHLPKHQVPQDTFIYTVDDDHGGTSMAKLTVTVLAPNQTYVPGTDGNDTLKAGVRQAVLDGGNGNDTLVAGKHSQVLIGGDGNDTLTGGNHDDTFVFGANFGKDVITDFQPKTDHIQIDHTLFASFADLHAHAASDGHGSTVITYDANDAITITGVALSHLHAGDFFFV